MDTKYKDKYLFCKREYLKQSGKTLVEQSQIAFPSYNFLITTKHNADDFFIYDYNNDHNKTKLSDIINKDEDNININLDFNINKITLVDNDFSLVPDNGYDYILGMNVGNINVQIYNLMEEEKPVPQNLQKEYITYFKNVYSKLKTGGKFIFFTKSYMIDQYNLIFDYIGNLVGGKLFSNIVEYKENFINNKYRIDSSNVVNDPLHKNRSNFGFEKISNLNLSQRRSNDYNILIACHTSEFRKELTDASDRTYLDYEIPVYIQKDDNVDTRTKINDIYNNNRDQIKFDYDFNISKLNYVDVSENQRYVDKIDYKGWEKIPSSFYDYIISIFCSPIGLIASEYNRDKTVVMNNTFLKNIYNKLIPGGKLIFTLADNMNGAYEYIQNNLMIEGERIFNFGKLKNNFFHGRYNISTVNGLAKRRNLYYLEKISNKEWI
jgi:uncharacterized protein YxeA